MNISFRPTADFSKSAAITYDNMRSYYEHYSVDWDQRQILEHIVKLESWDILFDGEVVGAIRLEYERFYYMSLLPKGHPTHLGWPGLHFDKTC